MKLVLGKNHPKVSPLIPVFSKLPVTGFFIIGENTNFVTPPQGDKISAQTFLEVIDNRLAQCNVDVGRLPVNRKYPENRKLSEKQRYQPNLIIKVWSK